MATEQPPPGWVNCRLGDLVVVNGHGVRSPQDIDPNDWILELEDVSQGGGRLLRRETMAVRASRSAKSPFDVGDVLYGKLRPYLNKVLLPKEPGLCSTEILVLTPPSGVLPSFLFYWLSTKTFRDYADAASQGSNMPRLNVDKIKNTPLVLAPHRHQRRIVELLDRYMSLLDTIENELRTVPDRINVLRESSTSSILNVTEDVPWVRPQKSP